MKSIIALLAAAALAGCGPSPRERGEGTQHVPLSARAELGS